MTKRTREPRFEVLWYNVEQRGDVWEDYETKEFYTRKQALKFYESIKDDPTKDGFWVTHRDEDWFVIEDIII